MQNIRRGTISQLTTDELPQTLVDIYVDLLTFFLNAVKLFEESHFVLFAALEVLKPTISGIVESFNEHTDLLSELLEAESFASIQEVKDAQIDGLSR